MVEELWPGVSPAWSSFVRVPSTAAVDRPGTVHKWHVLDNGPDLAAAGVEPAGTLLCVHGNPTWSYLWRSMLAAGATAQKPWRVVAVDQLDMGFSQRTGTFRRLEDRITDLGNLTDALGISGQVVTAGHDWGGVISLGWALRHRRQLAGVVLTNTAVHPAGFSLPPALKLALHPAVHPWGTRSTDAFIRVTHALAQPALSADVKNAFALPYRSAARREGVANFVADIPADETHPSWRTLNTVADGIRRLNVPSLVLWGPKDPVFSDRYLRDLLERLPASSVHRFEGAGHLLHEDVDIASPVFSWLRTAVEAPADTSLRRSEPFRPMLAELDERADDTSAAVVDMAPLGAAGTHAQPRTLSWAELAERVNALAAGLAAAGVHPGTRVNLLVPPGIELTSLIYACLRLNAVIVVADAGLGTKGLGRAIKGAGPAFLIGIDRALIGARALGWPGTRISVTELAPARKRLLGVKHSVAELIAGGSTAEVPWFPAEPDADAAVLFTSGSTGPAKGVVYTHRQLAAMRDAIKDTYNLRAGTSLVAGFAPFALLGPALGATSVTPDMDVTSPRTLTASALADAAVAVNATTVFASPAALTNVTATSGELDAAQRTALGQVDLLLSAGAPIGEQLLAMVQDLVPNASLHTPYGMTEALPVTDISLAGIRAAGSGNGVCVGTPVSRAKVAIAEVFPDGSVGSDPLTTANRTGEILVRAPHVKDRYDRLWITERHSSSITGWHRTGDVGHLDGDGRLWVEGRLGHILTTAEGVRTPVAAEQAAESVDGVGRVAVVGVGPAGAQVPVAVLETSPPVRRAGTAAADLSAKVRSQVLELCGIDLAAVLVLPAMPTDIRHNSKIDRTALAGWASQLLAGGPVPKLGKQSKHGKGGPGVPASAGADGSSAGTAGGSGSLPVFEEASQ
ncbi:alpha/beta fold hydrolase [Arthrobacter sp. zg-Y20]|uniref:alpha/beta fold hydrolase n=1 Tax=unclassified Arthrobacter TaxID=235627 RepID=UPI001D156BF9|nr:MULTISPECIES: alpha/beta fold hydrolase [unclassified Arthrobacter]MCC3275094.1 alpha/beta fold hydrolase [Arthrobacter sp. zg-Y20]MDK1315251.1 alpha/beta fold hydrolase [Arthrobacter sp. zg.Y20]WIB05084.1 alpha/beta fold hydrolase [Arthrobacter sp. zg-Y20]